MEVTVLLCVLIVVQGQHLQFSGRMGVIGPPKIEDPPNFDPESFQASSSDISQKLLKLSRPLPLSPYSPHNIFTVDEGVHGLGSESLRNRARQLEGGDEYDLQLKIKALNEAKDNTNQHHVLSEFIIIT